MSSQEEKGAQNAPKKTVEISKVFVDPNTMTLSANVKITGEIRSEDKWTIADASTVVRLVKVPLNDLITRVVRDWFWVRKIQDTLRKGTLGEARAALNAGWDWNEALARRTRIAVRTPADVLAGVLADPELAGELTAEEKALIEGLMKKVGKA